MAKASLLFASSEVYPFAKSGGLADVAHSLPRALNKDYAVHVVMPLYQFVDRQKYSIAALNDSFVITMGGVDYPVELLGCEYEGVNYRFIYSPLLCDREFLYGTPESGYADNALRFGLFDHAVVALLKRHAYDIAHLNDWQCGLVPLLVKEDVSIKTKTVYTIHNLAYQGTFESSVLTALGIGEGHFSMEGVEFYGQLNFMKAGIAYADRVTTVSPTYAQEILSAAFGCGLEGFLQHHRNKLVGIVNGIDTEHFSPSQDKALVAPYSDLRTKGVNKRAYLKEVGLKDDGKPLFIFIGRFTWQKGLDLLVKILPYIAEQSCSVAILGEGEEQYHKALQTIAQQRSNIHLEFGYDESLSRRMYAAADFFLMPSLFEPCGLAQMIAMHYGEIPVVHAVGGLVDTVQGYEGYNANSTKGYGVTFASPDLPAFTKAVEQALALYADKPRYNKIVKHNMRCDFSWQESAKAYHELYTHITKERSHG